MKLNNTLTFLIEPESVLLQPWTPGQDNSVVRVLPLKTENVTLQNVHNGQNGVHGRLAGILIYLPIILQTLYRLAVCLHFGKTCSHSCGGGTRMKTRRCPVSPFYNGNNPCGDGQSEVTEACNQNPCLPDPEWTPWGKFILCPYNYFLN